jgi:hypothetical protein
MEPLASDGGPGMFAMPDAAAIEPILTGAGFDSVRTEPVDVLWRFGTRDEYWSFVSEMQGPVAAALAELDDGTRADFRQALEERASRFADGDGYALPGLAINTVAA